MRQRCGKSIEPWSGCSSLRSIANRLDLPAPFAPIRPILSPGLRVRSASSSSGLVPRMRLTLINRIILLRQLLRGQEEHRIVADAGGEPGQAQVAEGRFRVLALVADLDHQYAFRRQALGGAVDDLAHQV